MTHVDQGGCRHKDDLQDPEANEGDRECTIIADCLAAWLVSVADKLGLLIIPYILSSRSQNQHTEDEEYGKPDLAHNGGVNVPVTHSQLLTTSIYPATCGQGLSHCELVYM
uniref:Uncharacterized protein n=1 Tax=Amphiprion percula TaxID=161767 RepID=A0A3P8SLE5_AMPPE